MNWSYIFCRKVFYSRMLLHRHVMGFWLRTILLDIYCTWNIPLHNCGVWGEIIHKPLSDHHGFPTLYVLWLPTQPAICAVISSTALPDKNLVIYVSAVQFHWLVTWILFSSCRPLHNVSDREGFFFMDVQCDPNFTFPVGSIDTKIPCKLLNYLLNSQKLFEMRSSMFLAQSQICVIVLQTDLLNSILASKLWLEYLPLTDFWAMLYAFWRRAGYVMACKRVISEHLNESGCLTLVFLLIAL